jgi:hypothetical protein
MTDIDWQVFCKYIINKIGGKKYEYLDNFYRLYDPQLDRKHGVEIKVQEVFKDTG